MEMLTELSFRTSEDPGSNPGIGNLLKKITLNCMENTKIKKKSPGSAHLKRLL